MVGQVSHHIILPMIGQVLQLNLVYRHMVPVLPLLPLNSPFRGFHSHGVPLYRWMVGNGKSESEIG